MKIRDWISYGMKDFFIAVNVSVMQIKDESFYQNIFNLINEYKIPSGYLEIDVTESVLMEETDRLVSLFKKLKLLGVRKSINVFGTGYSSFNYLMNFPVDKIKIDQSFIRKLPDDTSSVTIVTAMLRMVSELGIDVVAEGVETMQQFDFLKLNSCEYYQGYVFFNPIPAEDYIAIEGYLEK
jgi:EAL domain-containing protein (putative c-di-GMP-specific phosphodiesterase class I)